MAIPTITKMQKTAQQMLDAYKKQQTASTTATQSGSTSTPTVSSTPKVTQTQKAQPSVTQPTVTSQIVSNPTQPVDLTKINLFKPQETVKTLQSANLLTQNNKVDSPTVTSVLTQMYDVLPDNMKWPVDDAIENNAMKILYSLWVNKLRSTKVWEAANMFSNKLLIWWARETIDIWQWYMNKVYNSWLLPWKRNFMMNMMLPWYWLYRDYLNNKLENTQIWQQTKQIRDTALKTVFDWTERWDQKLANLEWYKYATEKQKEWSDKWKGIRDAIDEWRWDIVATNVWETAWQMLPSLIMAFVTKDPKIAAWWIFTTVFWSSYKRSLLEVNNNPEFANLTPDQKDNLATSMAVVEAWIETLWDVIELAPFMKGKSFSIANMLWIKNALLRTVVERQWASVIEWWEEVLTEILQNAFKRAYGWSDRATAEELWQIFSDTYFIMQFLWLLWWTKWWIETHRRNTAEKLLAHEAENFDDFEEFLESAHRWWVEDDELIADAWATSKWLTNEERVSIKKDTADIKKQEDKARDLYEERATVESTLNTLRQSPLKNQSQITKLEVRLQEIDNKLQDIDNKIQEYNDLYWKGNVEVIQAPYVKQEWGKNLSQQTMQTVAQPEVEEISRQESQSPAPSESQQLYEYTEAKKIWTKNRVSVKDVNKILKLTWEKQRKEMSKYSLNALWGILNYVRQMMPDKYENIRANAESVLKDLADAQEKIRLFEEQYWKRYEPEKMLRQSEAEWKKWTKFVTNNMKADLEHLVWLKWVTIKDTDKKIDKKIADYLSLTLSEVMTWLWIDFNKVLKKYWLEFQLTTSTRTRIPWEWIDTRWIFVRSRSRLTWDIVRIWMWLLLNWRTEQEIRSTLRHELIHMLDGTVLTKWWAFEKYANYRDFYTFKWHEKNSSYWNDPSEVIARYWQQYLADIFDKQEFEHLCNEDYFWSKEDFEKLKWLFEDFISQFSDLELDDANKNYYWVMIMLNDYKQWKLTSDEKRLESIRDRYELWDTEMSRDIEQKILSMEKEYAWITEQVESLEWDIKDEIKLWYEITLQEISTNLDMLATMKEKYIEATKNTKAQQENLNEMTNTISDNIEDAETSATDVEQGSEVISDTVTEPESEDNPTWVDTKAPLHEQVKQSVDVTLKSVDKLIKNKKNKAIIHEVWQWFKNAFTPALSRLYSISPRLAWWVHRYQAMKELLTNSYKKATLDFVKAMDKLKKKNPEVYKKLSLALFDYWMVDTIEIKEELKKAWIDPKLFEPVAQVLNQIAKDYQAAWLDITVNDKYFPRKVKDYGLLLDYLSMKSGKNIEDTRTTLLKFIEDTNNDPTLSEWEKEKKIHSRLINEFSKPSEMSNNAKERKLVLSEWQLTEEEKAKGYKNDITDFYEEPIVALSMYIEDMVKKTELKKMLWWLTEQWTAISEDFDTSVAWILMEMQAKWELTKEQADEAAYVIKSIVNVKPSWKLVQAIKDATYNLTIANYLSAAQQLEDLAKTLLRWPSWFKNIVKSILGKAWIKMKDTWLNNLFDTVQKWWLTDWNFKLSWFDMVDSLWKVSFLNTAYDSCVKQANGRRAIILQHRLTAMYGEVKWMEIFEKYKEWKLKTDEWLLDLDLMVDLLYQLGSTQPIYQSAMPTAYLNNPWVRLMYCLYSFSIKQVDWLIQWTKEVYQNQLLMWNNKAWAATVAGLRCIRSLTVVALISALVGDLISTAKWDEEDTVRWNWINNWWKEWLKRLWINGFTWFLKIFNISRYDSYIFKREWLLWVLMSKLTPASVSIANDLINIAVWKEELSDLWRYWPLFLKPMYYIFKNNDMMPDYKLWEWSAWWSKSSKFGKTSVWTSWPVNTSKFWWYSVK